MSKLPIAEAFREWARTATKAEKDQFIIDANAIAKGLQVVPARLTEEEIAKRRQYLLDLRAKIGVPKKVNTATGELKDCITEKKVRVPKGVTGPFRLSRKDWRKAKSTGDWVGDAALQHQKDQEDIERAAKKAKEEAKKAEKNARRVQARLEAKKPKYVKPDFAVTQKNLTAQFAFPVARLEEFLSMFRGAVYDLVAERMSEVCLLDNPPGEHHPVDARRLASAILQASRMADLNYRSMPDYCEVDYFFWIVSGWVLFGCVLPSSENFSESFNDGRLGHGYLKDLKWIKTQEKVKVGKFRLPSSCMEGSIPNYVKMLSFKSGDMIGVQEFAKRMVKNIKEREWAIRYALNSLALKRKNERLDEYGRTQRMQEKLAGGAGLIARERARQIEEEGFDAARDNIYIRGELVLAAQSYANSFNTAKTPCPGTWPKTWDKSWWKPSDDTIVNLTKAGASLAAEIDRIQRARNKKNLAEV